MTTTETRPPDTSSPARTSVPCSVWFGPIVTASEEREFIDMLVSRHGVGVCCWPRDEARIEHLARAGVPRLLLVGPDAIPPVSCDHQVCVCRTASSDEIHEALVSLCDCHAPEARRSA
jgi:hypothetical protein